MQADDILQRPAVAIVILTWNGRKFLEQYLPSVVRLPYQPLDIYIADNASTDDTVDFVKANYPSIKIIAIPKNEGFAKGYNVALKQVVADYYFLVNQDVELTPNCLEPMIEIMESNVM
ncbi:MAG TPA: glycosyltransferase, partial [Chitinophagales bacterium]|nr:glycosyltransferase [Chitinophagales bacterium]